MGNTAQKIIDDALALDPAEREEVIAALVASLEPEPGTLSENDPGFWNEIDRRYAAVVEGTAQTSVAEDVHARLAAKR